MEFFSFQNGLTLRYGARLYDFVRELDGEKVQFQDQITMHTKTLTMTQCVKDVQNGRASVVSGQSTQTINQNCLPSAKLQDLPPKHRAVLERRMAYVTYIRKQSIRRGEVKRIAAAIPNVAKLIDDPKPPSADALMRWLRKFEKANLNPLALVSGNLSRRREKTTQDIVDQLIKDVLRRHYYKLTRPSLVSSWELVKYEQQRLIEQGKLPADTGLISRSTVWRRAQECEPYFRDKSRFGEIYARAKYRTSFGGKHFERPYQRLECDHTPLDWVVVCDRTGMPLGRPTLTIIVDRYSSYIVGFYISFSGTGLTAVFNTLKVTIQPKGGFCQNADYLTHPWHGQGIPETLALDNGLEFHSPQFQTAAWSLAMDIEYCRVRTPWLKPSVERAFAELGHLPAITGRIHKPIDNVFNIDPRKNASMPFSLFCQGILKWIVDIHPLQINERKLARPLDLFVEGMDLCPPAMFMQDTSTLDMLAAMSATRTVSQSGIEMLGLTYSSPELLYLKKAIGPKFKTQVKWDPDDMGHVYLQNPKSLEWLTVPCTNQPYSTGLSWVQHKLIRQQARSHLKRIGAQTQLERAKQELIDMWAPAAAGSRNRLNQKVAAKFQGLASNKVLLPETSTSEATPAKLLVESCEAVPQADIPDFETYFSF